VKQGRNKTASDLFEYLLEEYSGESRRNEYWTVKKTGKKVAKRSMVIPAKRTMVELYGHQLYTFETDTELFQELKEKQIPGIDMEILSMGMSHDYQVAIEEGANMIRVGRSMFA
jgi:hypothetical protein